MLKNQNLYAQYDFKGADATVLHPFSFTDGAVLKTYEAKKLSISYKIYFWTIYFW